MTTFQALLLVVSSAAIIYGIVYFLRARNAKKNPGTISNSNTSVSGFPVNSSCTNCETVIFEANQGFSFTARWKDGFGKEQSAYVPKGSNLSGIQVMKDTASGGPFRVI